MLIGVRACARVLGQRLKNIQIALRSFRLVQTAFDHRQLVIASCRIVADLYISSKKVNGFGVFLSWLRRFANSSNASLNSGFDRNAAWNMDSACSVLPWRSSI